MDKVKAAAAPVFGETPGGPTAEEVAARRSVGSRAPGRAQRNNGGGLERRCDQPGGRRFLIAAVGNADRADYGQSVLITYGDGKTPPVKRW